MSNNPMNTELFDRAAKFAIDAHSNTERRGKQFPYVIHVMEAASICATITNDPDILSAAILHDTIEDCGVTMEELTEKFNARIAMLVADESDNSTDGAPAPGTDWKTRKEYAIHTLANASRDAKIVAMGDKLSNMRAIARDYNKQGDALWDMFHAEPHSLHEWHYRELVKALSDLSDTEAYQEFAHLVDDVFSRCEWNR